MMEDLYDIVTFRRDQMADFDAWILPDVYEELLAEDEFAGNGIIAIGALREDEPCGAAICTRWGNGILSLISIVVAEPERRSGLGRRMLDAAVREAVETVPWSGVNGAEKQIELHTEYVMPEEEIASFDEFLHAYGFRDYSMLAPVFSLNASAGEAQLALNSIAELPDEGEKLCAVLEESDLPIDPELSFYVGDAAEADMVFVTNPAGDHTYFLTSDVFGEVDKAAFEQGVLSVLKKIEDADAGATVLAPAASQPYADVLERLARKDGQVCIHREASCYIVFKGGEAE